MPMAAWRDYTRPDLVFDGQEMVRLAPLWLASNDRRTVSRLVFEPDLPRLAVVPSQSDPEPAFNTWPGFATQPSPDGSCDLFLRHLHEVIADGDDAIYQWVLMWLAAIVQSPARLPGTALVLRGEQGAGKDTVGEIMRAIIGAKLHTTIADPEQLTGRFNAHQEGKLLLQIEEGFFAGHRGDRGKLKNMITAATINIERKGIDPYETRNCARLLITSNEDWVVPAEFGNRRFQVLQVSGHYANDLEYHGALRAQMFERGGCARFLHHLLSEVVVDWNRIMRPLATPALRDQQIETMEPDRRWLLDLLMDGALPGDAHGEGIAPAAALYRAYVEACGDRRTSKERLGRFLKKYGVKNERAGRASASNGVRERDYHYPPLSTCRARFGREFAFPLEWDHSQDWIGDPVVSGILPFRRAAS
jgi:hypothetical protein